MPRPIPTPDEIRARAAEVVPSSAGIRYGLVCEHIRTSLRTTKGRASDWLEAALLAENSDLLLISTSSEGIVQLHTQEPGGIAEGKLVGNTDWQVILNNAGGFRAADRGPAFTARADYWVIRASTLSEFEHRARGAYRERADAEFTRRRIDAAYVEENHGDAVAVLRGLFARAGVLRNHLDREHATHHETVRAHSRSHPDGTRYAEAVITLRDDDINAVAAVLAELGIKPADEPELTESAS